MPESLLLWLALAAYGGAGALCLRRAAVAAFPLLALAVLLHTGSLATRWAALGHGPFTTMHEILSSNLWSLSLVLVLAAWALREVRAVLGAALPVLVVLGAWLLLADASPGHLPSTYATPLLYIHALVGKVYLGLLLVAVALGARSWWHADAARSDELAHRFAAFALVFDSLMLIVGAVWAQDAWGRWWAWDPLESWAFASWLALVTALHARAALRPTPRRHAAWLAGVFVLAFLTFFGVPFISTAPHQGAL
ncbi:MAG: cytochrome c biogenesis protein CcsA [Immundisolibacter sp.]|uniref:cytochrome c biogenesis protein CcsA n=1 Tax=Immundisolibacter sp. TaxID=1934948 RepID=UPI003D121A7A